MKAIYHYTTLQAAIQIIKSGYLKVSGWEQQNGVPKPALWLSLHSHWEPTATKMVRNLITGEPAQLSFKDQSNLLGCFRFVIPFEPQFLCPWKNYGKASGTSNRMVKAMMKSGKELNAKPEHWYASFSDIPLGYVVAQELWDGKKWICWDGR